MNTDNNISQSITLETRLSRGFHCDALSNYAELFSRLSRIYFSQWSDKKFGLSKEDRPNKTDFIQTHKISGRQFNAIKVSVEGMVSSQKRNLPRYLAECQSKIHGIKRIIAKKKALIQRHKTNRRFDLMLIQQLALRGKTKRLDGLNQRKKELSQQIDNKTLNVCFGSKALFKKQFNLDKNNDTSHAQWRNDWQASRSSQFFVLGSSDETGGNQGCTLFEEGDGYKLRLLLPESLRENDEKYVWLENIRFPYLPDIIKQAVSSNRERCIRKSDYNRLKKSGELPFVEDEKKGLVTASESVFLTGLGQALSYRFIKDNKGWRVIVSTRLTKPLPKIDFAQGALGVDFNEVFVSLAYINKKGQKIATFDLSYSTTVDATSRQNKTKMEEIALTIVDYARGANIPIAIEQLNFKDKKGSLQKNNNHQYNKMISQLSYGLFKQALSMKCFKQSIALVEVNPAYTSVIGRLKYADQTHFNTHQAAAWVIARRVMGLKDRLPKQSTIKLQNEVFAVFTAPEDADKISKETLIKTSKVFGQWLTATIKAERLKVQRLKKLIAPLNDLLLDF